jgi:hypothetical protein
MLFELESVLSECKSSGWINWRAVLSVSLIVCACNTDLQKLTGIMIRDCLIKLIDM